MPHWELNAERYKWCVPTRSVGTSKAHRYVMRVADWPHSSFHRAVKGGLYEPDWGEFEPDNIKKMDIE